jgi:soluble lytic murein transglycosylase-like protein
MPIALALAGIAALWLLLAIAPAIASDAPALEAGQGSAPGADPALALEPLAAAPTPDPGTGGGIFAALGAELKALWTPPAAADPYLPAINAAEAANALPQGLLARVLYQESRYRPDIINGATTSSAGALGIAQFMPATARDLGVDPLDPTSAINGAAAYLRRLFDQVGSWPAALAAYNWGVGNVQRRGLAAAPAETQAYVAQISADVGLTG